MFESFAAVVRSWAALQVSRGGCRSAIILGVTAFALFGCGRSSLDDSLVTDGGKADVVTTDARPDGPPDAGKCNPSTCPGGCCDSADVCRNGTDLLACGSFGGQCSDCQARGLDFCDIEMRSCGKVVNNCDFSTCGDGCCVSNNCFPGTDPNACGVNGNFCQMCASQGQQCDQGSRVCSGTRCGPENCPGCCVGDLCVGGSDQTSCGRSGEQCQNCAAQGTSCQPTFPGGICEGQPSCGPNNCKGCCAGNICTFGQDDTACGGFGQQCTNCRQFGDFCDASNFPPQCAPQSCGPQNCNGCCSGNTCVPGGDNFACGHFGQQCQQCGPAQMCAGGQCQGSTLCNPGNCGGCCVGDVCAIGGQNTACGIFGQSCVNCAANGQVCQGGACQTTCGPGNCPGCCSGNTCLMGGTNLTCGIGGSACKTCAGADQCTSGICKPPPPPCSAANCLGCCDATLGCMPGFLSSSCGSQGNACTDCTFSGSTCNTAVSPRLCRNQTTTCPAPYGACPNSVTTAAPPIQRVCSAVDLANARAACTGGPGSNGCLSFFAFEQMNNPQCASCLAPFDVTFQQGSGIFACVAPFVSAACDRDTGCATDCLATSCTQCPAGATNQCRQDVQMNQCGGFFQASQCAVQAYMGPGPAAFCNPQNYNANFGRWLQGVGGHYCGP